MRAGFRKAALALSIGVCGLFSPALGNDTFYILKADPSKSSGHVIGSSNPLLGETPFWTQVEPLVGQNGFCTDPSVEAPVRVTGINFTQGFSEEILTGFNAALPWFRDNGLYPLGGFTLNPNDPKAPGGIPVFCQISSAGNANSDSPLRPRYFRLRSDTSAKKFSINTIKQGDGSSIEEAQRIRLDTSRNLARGWGSGTQRRANKEDAKLPEWFRLSLLDAITVTAMEETIGLSLDRYDPIEDRIAFLPGDYASRISSQTSRSGEDHTRGAFFKYLVEHHIGEGWSVLDPLMTSVLGADYPLIEIDKFIDAADGDLLKGIEHAYPSFAAYYASQVYTKLDGTGVSPDRWLGDAFGGCPEVTIDETNWTEKKVLTIEPYASKCLIVRTVAKHSPWYGDLQIQAKLHEGAAGDDRVGDLFLSRGGGGKTEAVLPSTLCFERIENGSKNECMMKPSGYGSDPEGHYRQMFHHAVSERKVGEKPWNIVLFSYVPDESPPRKVDTRPAIKVEITFSVDMVIGNPGGLADVGADSSGEFALLDLSKASLDHGSKAGLMPISSEGFTRPDISNATIFDGTAAPMDGSLIENSLAAFDNLLSFVDELGNEMGFMITDMSVLEPGFTGPTDAYVAVAQKDGYMSIPDPDYDGKIEIIENTKDTLHFTADEGFCMVPLEAWPQMLRDNNPNLCDYGERVSQKATGSIAFPPLRRSDKKLEHAETESYRALRELRLAEISQQFGFNMNSSMTDPDDPPSPDSPPQSPTPTPSPTPDVFGEPPGGGVCAIREPSGTCDCSCSAKTCLDEKRVNNRATGQELSCRLTCGKRWKDCAP